MEFAFLVPRWQDLGCAPWLRAGGGRGRIPLLSKRLECCCPLWCVLGMLEEGRREQFLHGMY